MFDYNKAFSRNLGWLTPQEQLVLKDKRVAIAGAGGVGGEHMVTLARLGVGAFNISDFDSFEVHNFNRQAGAFMSTIGQEKCQVMSDVVHDINPQADINTFPEGIFANNVDQFLEDVDIYIDSLDFFALNARKVVFQACFDKNIPVVTAAPLGFGCALLCFLPGKMSFEQYFRFEDCETEQDQYIKFLIGLSPAMLQRGYLADESFVNFKEQRGPSVSPSVKMCAGLAASYASKILLGRGKVYCAPWGLHFDAYENKLRKTWRPFGNRNPIQKFMFNIAKKVVLSD